MPGFFRDATDLIRTTEKRSEVRNANGILQGNLLLKTCFLRRSFRSAECGRVVSGVPIKMSNFSFGLFYWLYYT